LEDKGTDHDLFGICTAAELQQDGGKQTVLGPTGSRSFDAPFGVGKRFAQLFGVHRPGGAGWSVRGCVLMPDYGC
jgi:hypothetical protein